MYQIFYNFLEYIIVITDKLRYKKPEYKNQVPTQCCESADRVSRVLYQLIDQKYSFSSNYYHSISNYIVFNVLKFFKKNLKSVLSPYF